MILKYLIMGCNGMAGHTIALYLKEQGHDVTGFARKKSDLVKTIIGDAENIDDVKNAINGNYDFIVNCIGILNQYAEENQARATFLNSYLPHFLADCVKNTDTRIIHLSTDCVFSGRRGQYKDTDLRDGETFYDRSKALGELEDDRNITVRTSIIGPDRNKDGIGLLNWFMKQQGKVKGYTKAIWTGLTTLELAKVIEILTTDKDAYKAGLFNIVPSESISKYELLKLFGAVLKNDKIEILEDDSLCVDKSLVPSKMNMNVPSYELMIEELKDWISTHRQLYPEYYSRG